MLRLAFLGCGVASRLHSRTLRRFPDVVRYYASRDAGKAAHYAKTFGGAGHFGPYEAALADPHVDLVLVATPPASHLELTRSALAAGKHVIVEKPAFLQPGHVRLVADSARAANRRVFVAENYFYKPLLQGLRRLICDGAVGEVRIVSVNALKQQDSRGWRDDPELAGGGAFFEGGIHWVSFVANLGLTVASATGFRVGPSESSDRTMLAVFQYREGAVGTLYYSWEIGSPLKGLRLSRIHGSAGEITFESNGLFIGRRGNRWRVSMPRPWDLLGYGAMFDDFFSAIESGQPARYELAAAERDLALVAEIYRTAATPRLTPTLRS